MPDINQSVGLNGSNQASDVTIVQQLLNKNRHLLMPISPFPEDGQLDESNPSDPTIVAIKTFQNRVVFPTFNSLPNPNNFPDGLVEPGRNTIAKLNENVKDNVVPKIPLFPLKRRPTSSYKPPNDGGRRFGAPRHGGRLHAACDLLQPPETEVRAMEDGIIVRAPYIFADSTIALEVNHGAFVARYGELSRTAPGLIAAGVRVTRGQVIGFVGRLDSGASMLHFEMYSGTQTGSLSVRSNRPYQRRSDLLNPTDFLDIATLDDVNPPPSLPIEGEELGRVSSRVSTILNLRQEATTDSDTIAELSPGTVLKVLEQIVGENYDANGTTRNDWFKVEYDGEEGFVAAFYIDLEFQVGRVNSNIQTQLNLRESPFLSGRVIAGLSVGTTFKILDKETGAEYPAGETTRNDWLEIEYNNQKGFVAAFYVDLEKNETNPNAILFTYESTGASDRTANQDGLPARQIKGVKASETMAQTDRERVMNHKEKFKEAAQDFNLPPALLAAIASRESRVGNVLDVNGWGDGGNAFGIMQVDRRFHRVEIEGGSAGQKHIDQATAILKDKLEEVERQFNNLSESAQLQTAISRYNGGRGFAAPDSDRGTTGGDYMNDVWARGRYYATVEDWT